MQKILYKLSPLRNSIEKEIKGLVPKLNKEDKKILEIGCGAKSYKKLFPKAKWIATDIKKCENMDKIEDVRKLSYKNNEFDVVFCIFVLEHVFEYEKAVSEIHRVLKKDGLLIAGTPFIYPLHDKPNDFWRFTEFSLKKILSKFEEVKIKPLVQVWKRIPMGYFVVAKK